MGTNGDAEREQLSKPLLVMTTAPNPPANINMPRDPSPTEIGHVRVTADGAEAQMIDVSSKAISKRTATALAVVVFPGDLLARLRAGQGPKGPIEETARIAGILAAKRTGELIPMCHPLGLDHVSIEFAENGPNRLEVRCRTACQERTGVEMEAMVGASVAALTIYDMAKGLDKGIRIESVLLLEKSGGKSGLWQSEALDSSP